MSRNTCLFALPRPLRKVLLTAALGKEGKTEWPFFPDTLSLIISQVEFRVNDVKQSHAMKLGEGGEAFFVFETADDIPRSLQTSPVVSPVASPRGLEVDTVSPPTLPEPEYLDLAADGTADRATTLDPQPRPGLRVDDRGQSELGLSCALSSEEPGG